MPGIALIVAGGARPDPLVARALPSIDYCVAADGGADHAAAIGVAVDAVVGDLDSISASRLAQLRNAESVEVLEFPSEKDNTDLELAFDRVMAEEPELILVVGIGGGRIDHELANLLALASDRAATTAVDGLVGSARISVVRSERILTGVLGEVISLLPIMGPVTGVTTEGLQYPLVGEALDPGSARGVSNRFTETTATVAITGGVLLAVQPFALKDRGGE